VSTALAEQVYEPTGLPHGRMAMWWFLASEVAIFGGLIMVFVLNRLNHPEWTEQVGHMVQWAGALNTFVLLGSSFAVVKAHEAAHKGEHEKAAKLLFFTVGCGIIFLCVKAYEYSHEIAAGFTPASDLYWAFYFIMTGLHGLHVVAGMVAMAIIAFGVKRGENPQCVEYVGMYWHVVDVIWIFLFPLLYLAG
jgi:heme/copper-type cytochrome/quinol oxidase subunit 3